MTTDSELPLSQFQYNLPDERIARFPVTPRDASKLLVYRNGQISHDRFSDLPGLLPEGSFLVFNNTRVIPARLHFVKPTGAAIELFLLNPFPNEPDAVPQPISQAMEATGSAVWQGMVGNRKRWKPDETLETSLPSLTTDDEGSITLTATWYDYDQSAVRLSWFPAQLTFAELLQRTGQVPLPPYLNRDVTDADRDRYQTIYARQQGAVAAPTAGLHFTPAVFDALAERNIGHDFLTLHVGAGTFQPIKTDDVRQHQMHTEQVIYTRQNIDNLLRHIDTIIAVGTTSMRALESLYWMGAKLIRNEPSPFELDQHYAYQLPFTEQPEVNEALGAVRQYMIDTGQESVVGHTGIYITPGVDSPGRFIGAVDQPGYQSKLCKGIVTNFHQPGSTLILLIASFIGNDWRKVYDEALQNGYRFLSYGDSSLLLP